MFDSKSDWRIRNQENYLLGKKLNYVRYKPLNENWDHDHCEFCWKKISNNDFGYCTTDENIWICEECFKDFRELFKWSVVE